jgi:hypothetical protein
MQLEQVRIEILRRLEAADPESLLLSADDLREWSDKTVRLLLELGLIRRASPSKTTACTGCEEGCLMPVHAVPAFENRPARFFVSCDKREDVGRVPVDPTDLNQFQVDINAVVRLLGRAFGSTQSPVEIRKDRLYHITNAILAGKKRAVFILRGSTWQDGAEFIGGLGLDFETYPSPLILVPSDLPPQGDRMHYMFVSLAHTTRIEEAGLVLDLNELTRRISTGRTAQDRNVVPFLLPPGIKWEDLIIRFVNEETVRVVVGSHTEHRTFRGMGFMNSRKTEETPDLLWSVLIWMAKHHGDIGRTETSAKFHDPELMKKKISEIRKRLKAVFPTIPGDPFLPYEKVKKYQARFILNVLPSAFETW